MKSQLNRREGKNAGAIWPQYCSRTAIAHVYISAEQYWASHPASDGPSPSSEGHKSTIFGDKLMTFARYLVMVVLMKGCWKKLASDEYFVCRCSPKMREKR